VRLILHIGTHKTGTTAIQRFLAANRAALAHHGFHFATPAGSPDSNVVANAVAGTHPELVLDFFRKHVETAEHSDAKAIVVSAENFYSMATVAAALANLTPDDAESEEPSLVRRLQSLLPSEISGVEVVGYFRRPDRFAESLYNQRIKYENFDEPFERHLELVEPMLAYHRNASAWADVFGADNCTFRSYEAVAGDIRRVFLADALDILDTELFVDEATRDNERVSRDVLEFKREVNRRARADERHIEYRLACQLEERVHLLASEPRAYQEFMSPAERADLLHRLEPEMRSFYSDFGTAPFPALVSDESLQGWQPYPGLSDGRRAALRREYARISGRPGVRVERLTLRASRSLRRHRVGRALLLGWRRTGLRSLGRKAVTRPR
jgi:hypothetical protein